MAEKAKEQVFVSPIVTVVGTGTGSLKKGIEYPTHAHNAAHIVEKGLGTFKNPKDADREDVKASAEDAKAIIKATEKEVKK